MTGATTDRLLAVTNIFLERRGENDYGLNERSAICQDALIFGIDVDEYVQDLEAEFGPIVRDVPWLRFTDQTSSFRGFGCLLVPFWLIGRLPLVLIGKPWIPRPKPREFADRLTISHLAAVIDAGNWIEP